MVSKQWRGIQASMLSFWLLIFITPDVTIGLQNIHSIRINYFGRRQLHLLSVSLITPHLTPYPVWLPSPLIQSESNMSGALELLQSYAKLSIWSVCHWQAITLLRQQLETFDEARLRGKCIRLIHLTHWYREKMAPIFQTTFSSAFSWTKMYEFWLTFHWNLFSRVQLTIFRIGSDNGLAPIIRQAIIWTNDGIVYWRIYASLGLNELRDQFLVISTILETWRGFLRVGLIETIDHFCCVQHSQ